jgi:hypothetical protein
VGLITDPYDFAANTPAVADQVDARFSPLYTLVNGNLDQANLKGGALGLARGAFHAFNNDAAFALAANSTDTKVKLAAEDFDVSGWFDATVNWRYTPLLAGYYRLSGFVRLVDALAAGETLWVDVYKNGAQHRGLGMGAAGGTQPIGAGGSCVVVANGTTDYFELHASTSDVSTRRVAATSDRCWFAGELIGKS